MKPQRVTIPNNKNEKLVGDLYKEKSKTLIIVCYGVGGSISLDPFLRKILPEYLSDISEKTSASVYGFDFSGEGNSEGKNFLSLRQHDKEIKTVIDYFSAQYAKIILYGYSLGGLSAVIGALHNKKVEGLITINGFFTLKPSNLFRVNATIILSYLVMHPPFALELYYRKKELKVHNITIPTLVVYADNDKFVNPKQSISFFNALRTKKKIFAIHGDGHLLKKEYKQIPPQIAQWMKEENLV